MEFSVSGLVKLLKPLSPPPPQMLRPESATDLYRPRDRRLSPKLVPTLADRGLSRGQGDGSLRP
jgi:hypothetical protein